MMSKLQRIVIKIGSNVLTRQDGKPNITRLSSIVDEVAALHRKGVEVIMVSSGAVTCGRSEVKLPQGVQLDSVGARQIFSAVGQVKLIGHYYTLFREHSISIGQVLTTKEDFGTRRSYLNQKHCIEAMIANGIVPVVNENDTTSLTELMFTDNDELSGMIAGMLDVDALVILSNVDGIFTGAPSSPDSSLIRRVEAEADLGAYISEQKSGFGRGGMLTKASIARRVAAEGIAVYITNGTRDGAITRIANGDDTMPCTLFEPAPTRISSVKKWIAHSGGFAKGAIVINDAAVEALHGRRAVSILPIGVIQVPDTFEKDDIVEVRDTNGNVVAVGKANVNSKEASEAKGKRGEKPIVHYDYLYVEPVIGSA